MVVFIMSPQQIITSLISKWLLTKILGLLMKKNWQNFQKIEEISLKTCWNFEINLKKLEKNGKSFKKIGKNF